MIALNRRTKIFVSKEATDMRASYDSLFEKVKTQLEKDPFSGHLFLFVNRHRNSCKCLYYDGTGLVIISGRPCLTGPGTLTSREIHIVDRKFSCFGGREGRGIGPLNRLSSTVHLKPHSNSTNLCRSAAFKSEIAQKFIPFLVHR